MKKQFQNPRQSGRLEVICGSMFSGKTEELMRRLKRAEYAKQNVLTIKHKIDQRNNQQHSAIMSHEGKQRLAFLVSEDDTEVAKILDLADESVDVVGIDEIQFFSKKAIEVICKLVDQGKRVIVAGLDLDFRGDPFGIMPLLLALADDIIKFKAICVLCGADAHHTQRMLNDKPARYDDPIILVGATNCYEARCRACFSIDKSMYFEIKNPLEKIEEKRHPRKSI